jgi:hypothetical protein
MYESTPIRKIIEHNWIMPLDADASPVEFQQYVLEKLPFR